MREHHPLAFCPEHGLFAATGIGLGISVGTTIKNGLHSCPHCSRMSEVIPGTYSMHAGKLDVLLDPDISPAALNAIQNIVKKAQSGEYSHERAQAEVNKISPKAGKLFDVPNWSDQAKATLYASIIGAAAVIVAAKMASSPTTIVVQPPAIERAVGEEFTPPSATAPVPKPQSIRPPRKPQ